MKTALTRWTPSFSRTTLDRALETAFNDMLRPLHKGEDVQSRSWIPAVDIRESDESLVVTVDLPGMSTDDVNLTIENNVLTLSGERFFKGASKTLDDSEREASTEDYHRIERAYGRFTRSFTLPRSVQTEEVAASFDLGVLTINLPKQEQAKARRINIS